jgi:DNA-binding Lrp family transcriptional regulator
MNRSEVRYHITATLLQADGPLTLAELVAGCGIEEAALLSVLRELVDEGQIVEGALVPNKPTPQYGWGARWEQNAQRRTVGVQQNLRSVLEAVERVSDHELDVDSPPSTVFYGYVLHEYRPPRDKRFLVFLQCSVRRPFSTAPSHAAMRRAIRVATGYDPSPSQDFQSCPVHVVVLASKIGPVPYELEDVYPANVRGSGVKHFDWLRYERVKPILAQRMAQYLLTFQEHYERITTFTEGRYAEVMKAARDIVTAQGGENLGFPILPRIGGPSIVRIGKSKPHQYWARYWIQLYLEIVSWLGPDQRSQAEARLAKLQVEVRGKRTNAFNAQG